MSTCPGEATLRLLGANALGDGTYAAIEQHVEGCQECKTVLERLAHPDHHEIILLPGPPRFPQVAGYEIQCELGSGAMGVVYRAIRTGLDRPVALKILSAASGSDADSDTRRHWLREARAVSRARHPNIVPLYDFGEADGCFYLVLEYVPGGSLKQRLEEPLQPRVAAQLVETIAHAVGHLHKRGLFHLDLKPSNILLDCEGKEAWDRVTPRISDFGLAVSDGGQDISESSLAFPRGTPSYMAPEQAAAPCGQLTATTDIYALGAILYELLTGRPPLLGTSTLETLDQVRHQNPVPPRRLNRKIPRDLETIALKCLEKNPSRRYASAEALAGDLRRWLDGKPILARPVSPLEHASRWCRRRPAIAALVATLMMTLSVGLFTIVLLWRDAEAERSRAEADFQTTNEVLGGFVERLLLDISPSVADRNRSILDLQQVRRRLLAVEARHPEQLIITRQLAIVDKVLGNLLQGPGRLDECRALYDDSLHRLDRVIRHNPLDHVARAFQIDAIWGLAYTAEMQSRAAESLSHYRRAVDAAESLVRLVTVP
jgi:serine/threonine protein kinase